LLAFETRVKEAPFEVDIAVGFFDFVKGLTATKPMVLIY